MKDLEEKDSPRWWRRSYKRMLWRRRTIMLKKSRRIIVKMQKFQEVTEMNKIHASN